MEAGDAAEWRRGSVLINSVLRSREADRPLIAKYDLTCVQVDRAPACYIAASSSEAPCSARDSDTVRICRRKQPGDTAWVRRGISIGKKYGVARLCYPVVVVVEDRGAVRSRLKAEHVDTKTAFEITRSGAKSLIYKASTINGSRFIKKVSHNSATNLPTIIFVALGKKTRGHH